MKIEPEKRIEFGDPENPGIVTLREPTNQEWNEYNKRMVKVKNHKVEDKSNSAAGWLFDTLAIDVENCQRGDVEVTMNNLGLIPVRIKTAIIVGIFQSGFEVNEDFSSRGSTDSSEGQESLDVENAGN